MSEQTTATIKNDPAIAAGLEAAMQAVEAKGFEITESEFGWDVRRPGSGDSGYIALRPDGSGVELFRVHTEGNEFGWDRITEAFLAAGDWADLA
jgi:hypothetical protein